MSIVITGKSNLSSKKDDKLAGIHPGNNSLYQSADYSPWFKSGRQPVFINKVLLEHSENKNLSFPTHNISDTKHGIFFSQFSSQSNGYFDLLLMQSV